jgi:hypothetical protein
MSALSATTDSAKRLLSGASSDACAGPQQIRLANMPPVHLSAPAPPEHMAARHIDAFGSGDPRVSARRRVVSPGAGECLDADRVLHFTSACEILRHRDAHPNNLKWNVRELVTDDPKGGVLMKMLRLTGLAFAIALIAAPIGAASAREFGDIYTDCGIGAIIAPHTPVVAAITNVTWDLGTTAILSNASSPDTCAGGKKKAAAFIYQVYPSLEQDLAAGRGAHLDALLSIAGCPVDTKGALTRNVRRGFSSTVAQSGYGEKSRYEKAEALYNVFTQSIAADSAHFNCTIS